MTWLDADGRETFQGADVVLCAANGIGTARLLLLSAHPGAPDGLANSSGLVGRRLMVHPGAMVEGYFDDDLRSWQGHFGGQIQSLEFGGTDPGRGFVGGTRWSLTPTGGPLAVAFGLRGRPPLGADHHRHMRSRFGRGARWVVLCEDLPDPGNRVELSATLVDGDGIPAPKVTYRISDDARRATEWSIERATHSLTEAGAHTVEAVAMRNNSHLLGTARMGDERDTSVVDRWGVAHDVRNLAIVDGSVFVTVGAANPTSTISALALRAVDHLLAHRADVPVPEPARHFATRDHAPGRGAASTPVALRRAVDDAARDRVRACWLASSSRPTTACPPPTTSVWRATCSTACSTSAPTSSPPCCAPSTGTSTIPAPGWRCCARPMHRRTAHWSWWCWPRTTARPTSGPAWATRDRRPRRSVGSSSRST